MSDKQQPFDSAVSAALPPQSMEELIGRMSADGRDQWLSDLASRLLPGLVPGLGGAGFGGDALAGLGLAAHPSAAVAGSLAGGGDGAGAALSLLDNLGPVLADDPLGVGEWAGTAGLATIQAVAEGAGLLAAPAYPGLGAGAPGRAPQSVSDPAFADTRAIYPAAPPAGIGESGGVLGPRLASFLPPAAEAPGAGGNPLDPLGFLSRPLPGLPAIMAGPAGVGPGMAESERGGLAASPGGLSLDGLLRTLLPGGPDAAAAPRGRDGWRPSPALPAMGFSPPEALASGLIPGSRPGGRAASHLRADGAAPFDLAGLGRADPGLAGGGEGRPTGMRHQLDGLPRAFPAGLAKDGAGGGDALSPSRPAYAGTPGVGGPADIGRLLGLAPGSALPPARRLGDAAGDALPPSFRAYLGAGPTATRGRHPAPDGSALGSLLRGMPEMRAELLGLRAAASGDPAAAGDGRAASEGRPGAGGSAAGAFAPDLPQAWPPPLGPAAPAPVAGFPPYPGPAGILSRSADWFGGHAGLDAMRHHAAQGDAPPQPSFHVFLEHRMLERAVLDYVDRACSGPATSAMRPDPKLRLRPGGY